MAKIQIILGEDSASAEEIGSIESSYFEEPVTVELIRGEHKTKLYNFIALKMIKQTNFAEQGIEEKAADMLRRVGIPVSLTGYRYLITALKEVLRDENVLDGITKVLYPDVAKRHNATPQKVEKAIRHAIEKAWYRDDEGRMKKMFANSISGGKRRPTNSEFIAIMANYLNYEFRQIGG